VLFDTNILIDYLNGIENARTEISKYDRRDQHISIITWMEVLVGAKASEVSALKHWLAGFHVIGLDNVIAERAVYIRQHKKIRLPDAIIWATAQVNALLLISRNIKDFSGNDPDVRVPYEI